MILDMVKQWINRIKKSSFIKSVLSLSSGVLIGQVILTLSTPVISRIYTASDMGDYTLIVSNANIIIAVSALGMLTVFMLPKEDTEARSLEITHPRPRSQGIMPFSHAVFIVHLFNLRRISLSDISILEIA